MSDVNLSNCNIKTVNITVYEAKSRARDDLDIDLSDLGELEAEAEDLPADLDQLPSAQTGTKNIRAYQARLSDLKRRVATWGEDTRPGAEFWNELYKLCEDLER